MTNVDLKLRVPIYWYRFENGAADKGPLMEYPERTPFLVSIRRNSFMLTTKYDFATSVQMINFGSLEEGALFDFLTQALAMVVWGGGKPPLATPGAFHALYGVEERNAGNLEVGLVYTHGGLWMPWILSPEPELPSHVTATLGTARVRYSGPRTSRYDRPPVI